MRCSGKQALVVLTGKAVGGVATGRDELLELVQLILLRLQNESKTITVRLEMERNRFVLSMCVLTPVFNFATRCKK
jgi:hypothetical protein